MSIKKKFRTSEVMMMPIPVQQKALYITLIKLCNYKEGHYTTVTNEQLCEKTGYKITQLKEHLRRLEEVQGLIRRETINAKVSKRVRKIYLK